MNNLELKEKRKKLGFTQTQLSELIGRTSMRTIQNWENGVSKVPKYVEDIINNKLQENYQVNKEKREREELKNLEISL